MHSETLTGDTSGGDVVRDQHLDRARWTQSEQISSFHQQAAYDQQDRQQGGRGLYLASNQTLGASPQGWRREIDRRDHLQGRNGIETYGFGQTERTSPRECAQQTRDASRRSENDYDEHDDAEDRPMMKEYYSDDGSGYGR